MFSGEKLGGWAPRTDVSRCCNLYLQTMKFGHLEGEPQPDPLGDENDNHGYEQLNNWDDPPQQQTHE